MEIPPEKKPLFYLVSIPVFLVGLVLGALLVSYVFFKTKDTLCLVSQPPEVSTELTASQIQQAASLEQNRTIFGEIISKDTGSFVLQFLVANPLDVKNSTTTNVRVTFDPTTDEVIIPKPTATTVEQVGASFSDIKVGEQVLLKILDGKKTIYITPSS